MSLKQGVQLSNEGAPEPIENAPTGPLKIGRRFVNWEIRALLGRGGYGFVYDAYNVLLEKAVALKVIPNPPNLKRARNEALVGEKLPEHPNVVKIDQSGVTENGLVYFEMERIFGRTIDQAMADYGRLTPFEILVITWQICKGVAAAHSVGVIHRDLKPANVFLERDLNVRVLDFGIATVMGEKPLTTQKDLIHGSANTLSPERLRGSQASFLSDIYSVGCMMFEMCTGLPPPLVGLEEITFRAVCWAHMYTVPPRLDELYPDFPAHIARLVQWCLAKKPEERFPNRPQQGSPADPAQKKADEEALRAPMAALAEACLVGARRMIYEAGLRGVQLGQGELALRPLYIPRAELEKELRANGSTAQPVPAAVVAETARLNGAARPAPAPPPERPPVDQTRPLFREGQPGIAAPAAPVAAAPVAPHGSVQPNRQPRSRLRRPEALLPPSAPPPQFISGVVRAQAADPRLAEAVPGASMPAPGKAPGRHVGPSPDSALLPVMHSRVTLKSALYFGAIAVVACVLVMGLLGFPRSAPETTGGAAASGTPPLAASLSATSRAVVPPSETVEASNALGAPIAAPAAPPLDEPSTAMLAPVASSAAANASAPSVQVVVARPTKPKNSKTMAAASSTPHQNAPDLSVPSGLDMPSRSTPDPAPTNSSPAPRRQQSIF